ncbi:MAG: hypothetical protein O3A63_05235 [Proteobacteria bacterium]|nr:hypothetical protein [Pseudomonadota bacterium]
MFEKFYRIWGGAGAALAPVGVAYPTLWTTLFGIQADSGVSLVLSFCFVFIGLLIVACSFIEATRARLVVTFCIISAHLGWLAIAVYNTTKGYAANLATVVLLNLIAAVLLMIIASKQSRRRLS